MRMISDMTTNESPFDSKVYLEPKIGRIVHFVMSELECRGECRPAIIIKVVRGKLNVIIFADSTDQLPQTINKNAVELDENKGQGTWHWPLHCDGVL